MSNIAKLKQKASEFEQKKQYEKALELYEQVLNFTRSGDEDRDVALYNRVGDLHYRLGNSEQAIHYYEKATDLYAEGGFFNNAIALCNKILRYSPGRSTAYYKLGLISAKKGFNSDAKQNFLEYADRMQKVGKLDEAFRALKEFADLCPGQDDVRLMLAEQLARVDRKEEALEQLQLLYHTLESEGRNTEAAAAVARMKSIDPTYTPQRSATPRSRKSDGLVFLDLGDDTDIPLPAARTEEHTPAERRTPVEPPAEAVTASGLELTSLAEQSGETPPSKRAEPEPEQFSEAAVADAYADAYGDKKPTPIELAPLVDAPADRGYVVEEAPTEVEREQPADAIVPTLHDASLVDPLAGLDVIEEPALSEGQPDTDDNLVDLGEWLARSRTPQSTRMVAHDEEPEDNQQKDFAEMLAKFKEGVAQSVDVEDFASHYDLGVAFREMGLVDEAISAFQKALRGPGQRIRASEALGECFIEKGKPSIAMTVLERVLRDPALDDEKLIGVLYLMGRASETLGKQSEAASYYQRVFAVDIGFRDIGERMSGLARAAR
jgi:tetratricopeptide (TPR) repeat protein